MVTPRTRLMAGVSVPDSPLITKAFEYARRLSEPYLFNHAVRSWLFAAKIAHLKAIVCDLEVENWSRRSDSNRGPADYESAALPTELRRRRGMGPAEAGHDSGPGESQRTHRRQNSDSSVIPVLSIADSIRPGGCDQFWAMISFARVRSSRGPTVSEREPEPKPRAESRTPPRTRLSTRRFVVVVRSTRPPSRGVRTNARCPC